MIEDPEGGTVRDDDAAAVVAEKPCEAPATGCACAEAGVKVDCGRVYRIVDSYVSCSEGLRTCEVDEGGVTTWGACIGDSIYDGGR
jgi:hypothetical protein